MSGMLGSLHISGEAGSGAGEGGQVSRVIATGETLTIADTNSLVVSDYFLIEGTGELVLKGDGDLKVL